MKFWVGRESSQFAGGWNDQHELTDERLRVLSVEELRIKMLSTAHLSSLESDKFLSLQT